MSTGKPNIKGFDTLRSVAARALDEDAYRQQLLDDPAGVLKQAGLTVPDKVKVSVHQNTADQIHLVLPTRLQDEKQLNPDEMNITTLCTAVHF